jgi:hypothetical protein
MSELREDYHLSRNSLFAYRSIEGVGASPLCPFVAERIYPFELRMAYHAPAEGRQTATSVYASPS